MMNIRNLMFIKIGSLRNFVILTGKQLCWSLFLIKLQALRPATLFKRHLNTGSLLWISRNFYKQFFYRTPPIAAFIILINNHCQEHDVGWSLLKAFVDLLRVCYLDIISRNHSNALLLINLQKTKSCPRQSTAAKAIFVLI